MTDSVIGTTDETMVLAASMRRELSKDEEIASRKALNAGIDILCDGRHELGDYKGHVATMRRPDHPDVNDVVVKFQAYIYGGKEGKKWRGKITSGELEDLEHGGDLQVQMVRSTEQLMGWNGSIYGVDLTGKTAMEVRQFFRSEVFSLWRLYPAQSVPASKPELMGYYPEGKVQDYDPDLINSEMAKMLSTMTDLMTEKLFSQFREWWSRNRTSGSRFTIGLATSSETAEGTPDNAQ